MPDRYLALESVVFEGKLGKALQERLVVALFIFFVICVAQADEVAEIDASIHKGRMADISAEEIQAMLRAYQGASDFEE